MATVLSSPSHLFHRFRILAYLLVVLSVADFAYAENNPPLFALTLAAMVISWIVIESRPAGPRVPRGLINVGVLTIAAILFRELVFESQPNLLLSLGHFMIGILICKFFERKTVRDYGQILTLTLLVTVAGAIFSASLFFAVILVAYLVLGLYAILLLHLNAETELARGGSLLAVRHISTGREARFMRRDIRRVAGTSTLCLIAIAVVVFLALPRTRGQGLFANNWSADTTLQTGFSDHVRFSDYGRLQQSDQIVMEVKLLQEGSNVGTEFDLPYFRGVALDNYDVELRQWSRGGRYDDINDELVPAGGAKELLPAADYSAVGLVEQQYTVHSSTDNTLFTISPPVSISPDRDVNVSFNSRDFSLSVRSNSSQPLHYSITSAVIYKSPNPEPALITPGDLGFSNHYDGESPRRNRVPAEIRTLAQSLIRDIVPDNQKPTVAQIRPIADRFEEYLRTTYPYSLTFAAKDATLDPTADFLLNRKSTGGHCEYFASAMVMLCRSVGLNARMVTGYHGGDFNAISGLYVIRQKHAHAWAEVYFPARGWILYDPSPSATDSDSPSMVVKWLRDISEVIQKGWQSAVIAFDDTSRSYVLNGIAHAANAIFSVIGHVAAIAAVAVRAGAVELGNDFKDMFLTPSNAFSTRIAAGVSLLLIVFLMSWLLRHWHRRRTSQLQYILRKVDRKVQRQLAHELTFFDELLRLLARGGIRKRIDQTPREYVETLVPSLRAAAPDARWLIATFYDVRFGTLRVTSPLRTRIAAALHHVRNELHQHHEPPTRNGNRP